MKIRDKLTFQFCAIMGLILIIFSLSIYFVSKKYRYDAFKGRLTEKALNTANLLIEVKQIDLPLLKNLRRKHLQSLPEESIQIYNNKDILIFSDGPLQRKITINELEKVKHKRELDFAANGRQFYGTQFKNDYVVVVSARNINGQKELTRLAFILVFIDMLGLLIIFISGRRFALHALRPISRMVKEVEMLGESNLSLRLDEGERKDEIAWLAITFNKMFDKIEDAFERQRIFVANASHELRTPLTTITGEIEVALMKHRSNNEYEEVLLSVLEEAKTLTRLSNDLLKLAKTGNTKGVVIEKISTTVLFQKLDEEILRRYPKLIVKFHIKDNTVLDSLYINCNIELLKTALLNIIDNAFKFSVYKPIVLNISDDKEHLVITIKDEGLGIPREQLPYIFQPFYRGDQTRIIEGTGVGLALTEKIIKLHGGRIEIYSEVDSGTEVKVFLPKEN